MRKIIISLGATLLLISLVGIIVYLKYDIAELPFQGKGTSQNPYLISNSSDLRLLSEIVAQGELCRNSYFLQTDDIDLEYIEWFPIGSLEDGTYFAGTYDGDGHIITGIYTSSLRNNGLFGWISGKVLNLGIKDSYIFGNCVGAIASHSIGTNAEIINCYSEVTLSGNRMGGIVDNFSGSSVRNCWSDCTFEGEGVYAGIVSYSASVVENCWSTTSTLVTDSFTGKIREKHTDAEEASILRSIYGGSDFDVIIGLYKSDYAWWSWLCGGFYFVLLVVMLWGAWKLCD